jgi:hypothetical protein
MIRDLWSNKSTITGDRVVVLDFDLSWYEGAYGRSTFHGKGITGYLAPEQHELNRSKGTSSRHTAVDVFGLGMLLFFVATGRDPDINEQEGKAFLQRTSQAIGDRWELPFGSIGQYLAETIAAATSKAQVERMGLPALQERIGLLRSILSKNVLPVPSDLALTEIGSGFDRSLWDVWDERESKGRYRCVERSSGATVEVFFDPKSGARLGIRLSYAAGAEADRSNIAKYTRTKAEEAAARLREGGYFAIEEVVGSGGDIKVNAVTRELSLDVQTVRVITKRLADAGAALAFQKG